MANKQASLDELESTLDRRSPRTRLRVGFDACSPWPIVVPKNSVFPIRASSLRGRRAVAAAVTLLTSSKTENLMFGLCGV